MLVKDILEKNKVSFSFEFFPPKQDADWDKLFHNIAELMSLRPAYVSVTYGAGGSTRDRTHNLVVRLQNETNLTVVSHLTTVGAREEDIFDILKRYDENNVHNILALRGDPPKGQIENSNPHQSFKYAAELVMFIKKNFPSMGVAVAGFPEGHPATPNRLKEIDFLKAKVDAGADYIVTQLFFDNYEFYDFCERCDLAGIKVPIVAGIMPIVGRSNMQRMAELSPGTRFPAKLLKAIGRVSDSDVEKVGLHWATEQVNDLLNNDVRGIHFYTLNSSKSTLKICETLGLASQKTEVV
ncbi:MAG: methylenetetrahydrofolate reductase [NAD(P)H] [Chloroherpetonaceae bacterium]|nr:methylenetetrahydrofolate reductase [NAD(P)H] [Chloroherpetonaceae bacterium]